MDQTKPSATGKIVGALVIGLIIGFALGAFWESRRTSTPAVSESLAEAESSAAAAASAATTPAPAASENTSVVDVKVDTGVAGVTAVVVPVTSSAPVSAVVFVENQSAGTIVEVTRVKSAAPVWVAVRELKGGIAGNILGVRRVGAGETSAVSVELLRPTVKGGNYIVALYADNGDPAFNYREDILIAGVQGAFVAE